MSRDTPCLAKLIDTCQAKHSLPADFYREQFIYQTDLEAIFYCNWIYAGHVSQLPESGRYFTVEFGNESIIIARGKDSEIRAFANVCRHRGSKVCLETSGKVSAFVCPYHAWTYGLDGSLRSKRDMPVDFEREKFGLKSIRLNVFHGLIFINLNSDAPDLIKGFEPLGSALDIYQLKNARVAHRETFKIDANWKLAIENFMECYHCVPAHAEYSCSHALSSAKDYENLRPAMLQRAEEIGYQTESLDNSDPTNQDGVQYFYNRSALYEGYVTGSESGDLVAPLLGRIKEAGGGAADVMFGPVTYAILYPDHAVLYRFLPTGVQSTELDIIWLVNQNAVEGKDYDIEPLVWLWTVTSEADKTIIVNNQKGVNSIFYEAGPLSNTESYLSDFIQWYLGQIDPKSE